MAKARDKNEYWLKHFRRCAKSSETAKGYATRVGLSPDAFYMARSRLKRRGLWPEPAVEPSRFARVEVVVDPTVSSSRFTIELASGARIHWERAPDLDQVLTIATHLNTPS